MVCVSYKGATYMSDKEYYQIIADEMAAKKVDAALWTKAIALAEGDEEKTRAAYIRLRLADLRDADALSNTGRAPAAVEIRPVDGLSQLRFELAQKLQAKERSSLYRTLDLPADASDAAVAKAITDREAQGEGGSAEFRYAKNTLGRPDLREQYDRNLHSALLSEESGQIRYHADSGYAEPESSWWESRKTSVIIAVLSVTLLGYLGLGYFKERGSHEIQKAVVDVQRNAVDSSVDNEKIKTQASIDYY
jgi:hypothetical protein